jgi:hypothetical protein
VSKAKKSAKADKAQEVKALPVCTVMAVCGEVIGSSGFRCKLRRK